jgi:drug/metabolite transporter (DMT)-like permease
MQNKRFPVVWIMLACVAWSFAGVLSKFVPWNALTLTGFRALVAAVILGLSRRSFKVVNTFGTWLGALGVLTTSTLFIFANKLTSAANAIVLQYAMPIVVVLFEAVALKKRPRRLDAAAVVVVTLGVVLCFFQGLSGGGMLGNALALLSAVTYATIYLAARRKDCDVLGYSYQGNLLAAVLVLFMPFDRGVGAVPVHFVAALGMGLCLTAGYLCFSRGMRAGVTPTTAAIASNIEPILNPTWCFLFLGEDPGPLTIAGALVVLFAVTAYTVIGARMQRPVAA